MIWSRLKNFECPQCKATLAKNEFTDEYVCKCGFYISVERFNDIVEGLYKPHSSDAYNAPRSVDEFASGENDMLDEHDAFWLNKKSHE